MAKKGKKLQEAAKLVDRSKVYTAEEAIALAKKQAQLTSMLQLKLLSDLVLTLVKTTNKSVVQ